MAGAIAFGMASYWAGDSTQHVFYAGQDGHGGTPTFLSHINELRWDQNSGWHLNDLMAATGAPLANDFSLTSYVWPKTFSQHVFYLDKNGHVYELSWYPDIVVPGTIRGKNAVTPNQSSGWQFHDRTAAAGAPPNAWDPLTSYVWPQTNTQQSNTQHVFYPDVNEHISELWWDQNSGWHFNDLTAAAS